MTLRLKHVSQAGTGLTTHDKERIACRFSSSLKNEMKPFIDMIDALSRQGARHDKLFGHILNCVDGQPMWDADGRKPDKFNDERARFALENAVKASIGLTKLNKSKNEHVSEISVLIATHGAALEAPSIFSIKFALVKDAIDGALFVSTKAISDSAVERASMDFANKHELQVFVSLSS